MSKWDLQPFRQQKISISPRFALKQLKDAILTGSRSISAYLKEKSGLPVSSPELRALRAPQKDNNRNEIIPSDRNESNLVFDENLVRVNNRKRRGIDCDDSELNRNSDEEGKNRNILPLCSIEEKPDVAMVNSEAEAEEDVDDGCHIERITIDAKKEIFLSSQSIYSQATTDNGELHLCMKCNEGGNLLSCASDSCAIAMHERCLGSDESFDTRETFYCPFCAYSRAISDYTEVKKYTSSARKDLAAFICSEPQNESAKRIVRSSKREKRDGKRIRQESLSRSMLMSDPKWDFLIHQK